MPAEAPLYRIHAPTVIATARGPQLVAREGPVEMTLPGQTPRNSWEPLNEAARDQFKRRDAITLKKKDAEIAAVQKQIDEVKAAGAGEAELAGFNTIMAKLRLERALAPAALKAVPAFGGAAPTHSLAFDVAHPGKAAEEQESDDPKLERIIGALIAGGGSEADVAAARSAFRARAILDAPLVEMQPSEPEEKKAEPEKKPEHKQKRASDS